jgi:hypothetical protein
MKEQIVGRLTRVRGRSRNKGAGMKGKFRRRGAMLSLAASLSVGGLILGIGAAEAAAAPISVNSPSGVYSSPNVSSGKVGVPDLAPGDSIIANCWNRGQNLGIGNVWYHTEVERYTSSGQELFVTGWTYGGFVDSNQAFHTGAVPAC